jgi:EmrB/QacA subfamily drug resistance transporter
MTHDAERQHYNVTFALLAVAAVTYALLQSLVVPALLTIQQDLHTSTAGAAWILTAYLLSASVFTPVAGRLGDMFGKKRVLVVVLLILSVGTVGAGLSSTIGPMIVARVVQGVGGAIFPLAFGIIRDEFPRERVPLGIALISAILGVGGGLGIVLAGPITQNLSYHWLFWFPLIGIVIATVGIVLFVPESPVRAPGRIDWLGSLLMSAWLVALLVGVSEGSDWGWSSSRVLGLFGGSVALFALWAWVESRTDDPLVDMTMMRKRPVWTTNLGAFVVSFGMFSAFLLVPQFVEMPTSTGFGLGASVTEAGLYMLPMPIALLLSGPISGRLSSTVGSRVPFIFGSAIACIGAVVLAVAHSFDWEIYLAMAVIGLGIGLAFAATTNLIVESVSQGQTGVATGMNMIARNVGGGVGSQVMAGIIAATLVGGLPSEGGFTIAFVVTAGAFAVGSLVALAVPRPVRVRAPIVTEVV